MPRSAMPADLAHLVVHLLSEFSEDFKVRSDDLDRVGALYA